MAWFRRLKEKGFSGFGTASAKELPELTKSIRHKIVLAEDSLTLGKPYRSRRGWRNRFRLWLAGLIQRLYLFLLPKLYTGKNYDGEILLEMFKRGLLTDREVIAFESLRPRLDGGEASSAYTTVLTKMEEFIASGDWETPVVSEKPKATGAQMLTASHAFGASDPVYNARTSSQPPTGWKSKAAQQQTSMKRNRSWIGPEKVEEEKPKKKPAKKKKVAKKRKR